jgi:hypothetical protein
MDVSFAATEQQNSEGNKEDEAVKYTLALLVQRIHSQQELAVGVGSGSCDKENDKLYEDNVYDYDKPSSRWSFEDAKSLILSDTRVRGLGVTWIALAELMNNFNDDASKDDVTAVYDEGEEHVLGDPRQIKVLRHARNKYLRKHDLIIGSGNASQRSGIFKTPQRSARGVRGLHKSTFNGTSVTKAFPSSVMSMKNVAPESIVSKDQNSIPTPEDMKHQREGIIIKFENIFEYGNPKENANVNIDDNVGPLSPTENLRESMKNASISQELESITTPLRRSMRIASRSSEKKSIIST